MKTLKSLLEQTQYRSFDDAVKGELGFSKEKYPNDYDRGIARLEKIRNIKNNPEKHGFVAWDGSDTQQASLGKLQGMEAAVLKNLENQFPKKFLAYSDLNRNKRIASGEQVVSSPAHLAKISGMGPEQATAAANRIGLSYSKYHDSLSDDEKANAKTKWIPFKVEDEFPDYKPTKSKNENIKKSRKKLIENYINLRCKRIMNECSQQPLKEQSWDLNLGPFGSVSVPTYSQIKKNVKNNWDKVTSQPIVNTVRDIGNFYSNVPIVGKVPGVVGGTIDTIQGVASGDKGQATDGLLNIAFSGMGGGPGSALKSTVKNAIGDTVNKQVKNVVADTSKIAVKNAYKDNLNPKQNTNTNVVTAGPSSGGGSSNQVSVNTPTTNTPTTNTNTNTRQEYVPNRNYDYDPQTRG